MTVKWILPAVLAGTAAGVAAVPLLLDRPFAAQTPGTLAVVYELRRWGPLVTVVLAVAAVAFALAASRDARWWARALLVLPVAVSLGAVWFARQNVFEWWFNPLPGARYVPARDAAFVDPADLVLAVSLDGDAAAYPIRQMAYHHLVNDRIGRTPAVVTY